MTAKLFTLPKQVQLTNSGALVPGGKAYFYINGTSTPQDTYTTLGLTTPHQNPVIADGDGKLPAIYLDSSLQYKVKLTDASDVEDYSEDNFTDPFTWGWSQTPKELAKLITPISTQYKPGHFFRYMTAAQITDVITNASALDVTTAINNAIQSGYKAFTDVSGTANIVGTIVLDGDKHVETTADFNLERQSGSSTEPVIHIYGRNNVWKGNKSDVRNDLYAHPKGIILIGPDPDETAAGTTDVFMDNNHVSGLKVAGAVQNIAQDGSPGIYFHSLKRKKGSFAQSNYKSSMSDMLVVNCDIGVLFGTDANFHSIHGLYVTQWKEAAVKYLGAYGNSIYGYKAESPLAVAGSGTTSRYMIDCKGHNDGVEAGTDVTYQIGSGYANSVYGSAELPSLVSDTYVRLFRPLTAGTLSGDNDIVLQGIFPGGVSVNGFSTRASVANNAIKTPSVCVDYRHPISNQGWEFRELDDGSGSIITKDSWALMSGRVVDMEESFTYDILSVDNVGTTSASVLIELTLQGKESTNSDHVGGKITWLCPVTASTQREPIVVSSSLGDFGGEIPFVPICVESAGTTANTGKFTVSIATQVVSGTGDSFCSWKADLVSSNLLGTNLDWDADLSYLTSSSSGLVAHTEWKSLTKHKIADESVTASITLQDDNHLFDWNVKADQYYKVTGHLRYFQNVGNFQYLFQFSQTPQEFSMVMTGTKSFTTDLNGLSTYNEVSTQAVSFNNHTDNLDIGLSVNGFFKSNATTGGTVDFQWAQETSSGNATILRDGSWLTIERL